MNRHLPFSAAAEKNKTPIVTQLQKLLNHDTHVLEIGSGTGQHICHFAEKMPHITWHPSDLSENIFDIQKRIDAHPHINNIKTVIPLDMAHDKWPTKKIDHIKIVDFDKEKMNEKIRNKMMEKRGMKNIKVRFFN